MRTFWFWCLLEKKDLEDNEDEKMQAAIDDMFFVHPFEDGGDDDLDFIVEDIII